MQLELGYKCQRYFEMGKFCVGSRTLGWWEVPNGLAYRAEIVAS